VLRENVIHDNGGHGVEISMSPYTMCEDTLSGNFIHDNGYALPSHANAGIFLSHSNLYSIRDNIIEGNPIGIRIENGVGGARCASETQGGGANVLVDNAIGLSLPLSGRSELGIIDYNGASYGGGNDISCTTGSQGALHV